jgi:hypothetical protein
MSSTAVEERLRRFLLVIVIFLCLGTLVELLLEEHYKESLQLIPFGLCGTAILTVLAVLIRPQRNTILLLRIVMIIVVLGSLLGIYLHLDSNLQFELEIRPNATAGDVWLDALRGANPLLAPGILALGSMLALLATYFHPALGIEYHFQERVTGYNRAAPDHN